MGDSSGFLANNGLEWGRVWSERVNAQKPARDRGEEEWQLEIRALALVMERSRQIIKIMYTEERRKKRNALTYHLLCVRHLMFKAYSDSLMWSVLL